MNIKTILSSLLLVTPFTSNELTVNTLNNESFTLTKEPVKSVKIKEKDKIKVTFTSYKCKEKIYNNTRKLADNTTITDIYDVEKLKVIALPKYIESRLDLKLGDSVKVHINGKVTTRVFRDRMNNSKQWIRNKFRVDRLKNFDSKLTSEIGYIEKL